MSATLTTPRATRCLRSLRVTLLACVVLTVKLLVLVTEPAGVVTLIGPVVAPAGTVAVILVDLTTLNVAAVPLKVTPVAPVKLVPVIVTVVPTGPKVGENEVIVGAPAVDVTLKPWELQSLPPGVVTQIFPVVAPLGTVAVIFVEDFTVNVAETPWNVTLVAPVKFVPVIVTVVPTGPEVGEKEVIVGGAAAVTVKFWELVAVPSGVVTLIGPVVAVGSGDRHRRAHRAAGGRERGDRGRCGPGRGCDRHRGDHDPGDDCGSAEGCVARTRHGCLPQRPSPKVSQDRSDRAIALWPAKSGGTAGGRGHRRRPGIRANPVAGGVLDPECGRQSAERWFLKPRDVGELLVEPGDVNAVDRSHVVELQGPGFAQRR